VEGGRGRGRGARRGRVQSDGDVVLTKALKGVGSINYICYFERFWQL
jgi:hypothetical protein